MNKHTNHISSRLGLLLCITAVPYCMAAALNYTVDDDGGECPGADYATIQAAIDACDGDSSIDTITIYAGTYNENLTVKTYLTLQAATNQRPVITANAGQIVDFPDSTTYSSITIAGLTVDGQGSASIGIDAPASFNRSITGLTLSNNVIKSIDGPGLNASGYVHNNWLVTDNTIQGCTSHGISLDNSKGSGNVLANNLVVSNAGWGLFGNGVNDSTWFFVNNTFASNTLGGFSGTYKSGTELRRCIIYGNYTDDAGTNELDTINPVNYSCVEGDWSWGDGNISSNPLFAGAGDFRLQTNSPCVNEPGAWFPGDGYTEWGRYGNEVLALTNGTDFTTNQTVDLVLVSTAITWTGTASWMGLSSNGSDWTVFAATSPRSWDLTTGTGAKIVYYRPLNSSNATDLLTGALTVTKRIQYLAQLPVVNLNTSIGYGTIQAAIDASTSGDIIEVQDSGTYDEVITLKGGVTVRAQAGHQPTIKCRQPTLVTIPNNNHNVTLEGFIIDGTNTATTGIYAISDFNQRIDYLTLRSNIVRNVNGIGLNASGYNNGYWLVEYNEICNCTNHGVALDNSVGTDNVLKNNVIVGNGGWGIWGNGVNDSAWEFVNTTISSNALGGMSGTYKSGSSIHRCIIYGNYTDNAGTNELDTSNPVNYCCIEGGWGTGDGNIPDNPLFVNATDLHLQTNSPCINDTGAWFPGDGHTEWGRYGDQVLAQTNGTDFTTNLTVSLSLISAAQTWTGTATWMGLSNDGSDWTVFAAQSQRNWDLPASEGNKTVYYRPLASSNSADLLTGAHTITKQIEYMTELPVANLTTSNRYGTIQEAIDTAAAGQIVEVQATRIFNEVLTMAAGITVRAQKGCRPVLSCKQPTLISIPNKKNNVTIEGLIIDGTNVATTAIYAVSGFNNYIDYLTIRSNVIRNVNGIGINGSGYLNRYWDVEYNDIYNCTNHGVSLDNTKGAGNVFHNNLVADNGGRGIWGNGINDSTWSFINNTIAGNALGGFTGTYGPGSQLERCIVHGNYSDDAGTNELDTSNPVDYCCVEGGWTWGDGNTASNPLFVGAGDYHLATNSPVVNDPGLWFPGNGYTEWGRYGDEVLALTNGTDFTTNQTVGLSLAGTSQVWAATAAWMGLSNDGTNWTVFATQSPRNWTLSGGTGNKTIYYRPLNSSNATDLLTGAHTVTRQIEFVGELSVVNLSTSNRYGRIQDAIDAASAGHIIEVQSSDTYNEAVTMKSGITLRAQARQTPMISTRQQNLISIPINLNTITIEGFIIDGTNVAFSGIYGVTGHNQYIDYLTIRSNVIRNINGNGISAQGYLERYWVVEYNDIYNCTNHGVHLDNNTSSGNINIFRNNLVVTNGGWGLYGNGANNAVWVFMNNTIADNATGGQEGTFGAGSAITNCIIYGNAGDDIGTDELDTSMPVNYSCIEGGWGSGTGNISDEPRFMGNGNYHLLPASPCVDTGNPTSDFSNEPGNGGSRINMGRYGNTPEAALAPGGGSVFIIR